ncbi:TOMM precursor leader peptide-binding protein [Paractinoplanes brasiliensis]|uniref:Bacteriocin biosynthesis cyclodehydratase domain-containing protein n=1 Tax=Paractinoplanes brasiliensis TaxID=52695 RepID=A0A4R6JQ26_9ACTN|nr:TOMM precursor leader peptide-binding protein [Actinoplanes brasiliensis]TDO36946.1 bacteriocin biosynthesis cyclodehydratase domain-containing protein [Actinoplanes brasiliensis]GID30468.1 hypothetical protein Abr02nite_54510 [Actinoplanes brasiliensis]
MTFVLFTAGEFGDAVGEHLRPRVPSLHVTPIWAAPDLEDLVAAADFVATALWRRYPAELDRLDEACHRRQVRWTSAVLEETQLRTGPLIRPGHGPCHACYRTRWMTHTPAPDRQDTLDTAYATHPLIGVPGFTPGTVAMAAAALLMDRDEPDAAPGRLRVIDLLQCTIEQSQVVPVHGCARCGPAHEPGERYHRWLGAALREGPP